MTEAFYDKLRVTNLSRTMRVNFSWILFGNLFYGMCQWGLIVIIAKLANPETVGEFSLGLAVSAPIIMFFNMQARSIQATDSKNDFHFSEYLVFRILTNIASFAVLTVVVLLSGYKNETALIIMIIGFAKIFEATSDIVMGLFQKKEKMEFVAKSLMIRGGVSIIVVGSSLYITSNFLLSMVLLSITWGLNLFCYDLNVCKQILSKDDMRGVEDRNFVIIKGCKYKRILRIALLALPLGLVSMLLSLNVNIPKYFIESMMGKNELGLFTSMAYLVLIGSKIVNAIGQVVIPRLSNYYSLIKRKKFLRLFIQGGICCSCLGVAMIMLSVFWGEPILQFMYGPEYALHVDVFVWIMIAGLFEYISEFFWLAQIATRQIRVQVPMNLIYITVLMASCIVMIPRYNLLGAAYAIVVTAAIKMIGNLAINLYAFAKIDEQKRSYI